MKGRMDKMESYFPIFRKTGDDRVILIGANAAARKKEEVILAFTDRLERVTERVGDIPALLSEPPLAVVVADAGLVDVDALYDYCTERRIEINTVDRSDRSTFIFPALVHRGRLTVAVSSGGASPAAVSRIKRDIEGALPENIEEILDWLALIRPRVRAEARSSDIFFELVERAFESDRPLTDPETEEIVLSFGE